MKIKRVSNLIAEIDGTEVTMVPVTLKDVFVPFANTGGSQAGNSGTTHKVLTLSQEEADKIVGYLLLAPEDNK